MYPNPRKHNADPDYIAGLLRRIGVTRKEAARRLMIYPGQFYTYLVDADKPTHRPCPYTVQYALEQWLEAVDQSGSATELRVAGD